MRQPNVEEEGAEDSPMQTRPGGGGRECKPDGGSGRGEGAAYEGARAAPR